VLVDARPGDVLGLQHVRVLVRAHRAVADAAARVAPDGAAGRMATCRSVLGSAPGSSTS
jgi:hypothetical protein